MKKSVFISVSIVMCLFMASCGKELAVNQEKETAEVVKNDLSRPLEFSSKESLLDAIKSFDPDAPATRSLVTGFVSYYDSVMQEEDYDERPNAIFSDAFGSILNPDGEVIYGDTFLKVGLLGLFYGPVDEIDRIRLMAESGNVDINSFDKVLVGDNEEYRFQGDPSIYLSDIFGLFSDSRSSDTDAVVTRTDIATYSDPAAGVIWGEVKTKKGGEMDNDYIWPRGSAQKTNFTSKVVNDTKIYKQHYAGLYDESGVKTKTMKK